MNTTISRFAAVAVVALSGAAFSNAAQAADATGNASATIATPIAITEGTALAFGTILAGASSSTIVVDTSGGRTVGSGDASLLGGTVSAASFDVTGEGSSTYSVSFSSGDTLTDGSNTMSLGTYTTSNSGSGTLSGGTDSFEVGATLTVGASQAAGSYTGTYTVTVNYN